MDASSCLVCNQTVHSSWLTGCRDFYLRTAYITSYGECDNCKLVQQVPIPADTQSYYPIDYPMHHSRGRLFFLARKLMIHGVYLKPDSTAKKSVLLDFGCGDGSYLQSIQDKVGCRLGFEPSHEHAVNVQRLVRCNVYSNPAEMESALEHKVDIITAHFVLEHLSDLHWTFRLWNRILKPGGFVHIALPNIRSFEARIFGRYWHGLDAPRHISFPEAKSLSLLAELHGFSLQRCRSAVFPNTWAASLAAILMGRYRHPLFLAMIPPAFVLACLFPKATSVFQLRKSLPDC